MILTLNTVFIERIYNGAKLKKTSSFYKIDHLSKGKVEEWLKIEGFSEKEIELIWDYYGGCIADILKVLEVCKKGVNLKEFLEHEAWLAYTEIDEFFRKVVKEIVEKGYYSIRGLKEDKRKFLQKWAEREILFYYPLELRVTGNSRIYEKGIELLLERV